MESFKTHYMRLDEMATELLKDLNREYIRKAMAIKSINIKAKDFGTLQYKREIQYMIAQHWFPKFPLGMIQEKLTPASQDVVNKAIKYLKLFPSIISFFNIFFTIYVFHRVCC